MLNASSKQLSTGCKQKINSHTISKTKKTLNRDTKSTLRNASFAKIYRTASLAKKVTNTELKTYKEMKLRMS